MHCVVILGAGFAGLELATRLSEQVADEVRVTLIDANDSFVFGYSKLDVMFGRDTPEAVRLYYRHIHRPSVEFRQAFIESIDPHAKRVITSDGAYDADILVVALGADVRPDETPGMLDGGAEFYSVGGAEQLGETLPTFPGGKVLISVLGPFFKCPAAPYESAMMLHSYLDQRGVLDKSSITVLTTLPMPIPISPEASAGIIAGLDQRGIAFRASTKVVRIHPATNTAILADGSTVDYDLFLGIPIHRAPKVVVDSGLTEDDGWIAVDHTTFATKFPGVYAAGDITSAPVPRVGVIAEGEAGTVAAGIIHQIKGGAPPEPYSGAAQCYIEFGGAEVARFNVNFLSGPEPYGIFEEPTEELAASKQEFGRVRRKRWFGIDS